MSNINKWNELAKKGPQPFMQEWFLEKQVILRFASGNWRSTANHQLTASSLCELAVLLGYAD